MWCNVSVFFNWLSYCKIFFMWDLDDLLKCIISVLSLYCNKNKIYIDKLNFEFSLNANSNGRIFKAKLLVKIGFSHGFIMTPIHSSQLLEKFDDESRLVIKRIAFSFSKLAVSNVLLSLGLLGWLSVGEIFLLVKDVMSFMIIINFIGNGKKVSLDLCVEPATFMLKR